MRLLYCLMLSAALCPLAHAVELLTAGYTPFTIVDASSGKISGVVADKVEELMRLSAEPFTLKVQPWTRSLQQVQFDTYSCAYPMVRTPQREQLSNGLDRWQSTNTRCLGVSAARRHRT